MKCPSCGFDSFLESDRCKRCGHVFGIDDSDESLSPMLESSPVEDAPEAEVITSQPFEPPAPRLAVQRKPAKVKPLPVDPRAKPFVAVKPLKVEPPRLESEKEPAVPMRPMEVQSPPVETKPEPAAPVTPPEVEPPPPEPNSQPGIPAERPITGVAPAVSAGLMVPDAISAPTGSPPEWKTELDQRVQNFRKRRARARGMGDSNPNLEFDFEEPEAEEPMPPPTPLVADPQIVTTGIDIDLGRSAPTATADVHLESAETASPPAAEPVFEPEDRFIDHDSRPVEFVLDDDRGPAPVEPEPVTRVLHLAPMTRRLAGGLIDAATLLFSGGVFAIIFWRAGGHVSSQPLTLFILALVVGFQMMVYFGAFTATISTTPGLLWMGIEIRSMAGGPPTLRQALWRALGCIVSTSALLLGFIWALFDDQGLTWHDRMSETYLAPSESVIRAED